LTVLYFQPAKAAKKMDIEQKKKEIEALREQLGESK
jgi:hypothetical protein